MNACSDNIIKCVIWDLDNTLWDGILLEGVVVPRHDLISLLRDLDKRGVLHSIASRGDADLVSAKLRELDLEDFFLSAQISFADKSESIERILTELGIAADSVVFVDDDPYERAEVEAVLPDLKCLSPSDLDSLRRIIERPLAEFTPEARARRGTYVSNRAREKVEREYQDDREGFLRDLRMQVAFRRAESSDVSRLLELMTRTNQMNSAGSSFEPPQIIELTREAPRNALVASYEDRFGSMGIVGVAVVNRQRSVWTIELLLVSCRVLSRGVGTAILAFLSDLAQRDGAHLRVTYVPNERNRIMDITLRLSGFVETQLGDSKVKILEHAPEVALTLPKHMTVHNAYL